MSETAQEHWNGVYSTKAPGDVSWFQPRPDTSLRLMRELGSPSLSVIDVGAGASTLADELLRLGWNDVTVLDVSSEALRLVAARRAGCEVRAKTVVADILEWQPEREYDLWHDRAVLHFLTKEHQRARYVLTAARAVGRGGHLVIGTFAQDGPTQCSGLPTARYSASELEAVFSGSFELIRAEREEHHTPSGSVQPFTWSVLRRV